MTQHTHTHTPTHTHNTNLHQHFSQINIDPLHTLKLFSSTNVFNIRYQLCRDASSHSNFSWTYNKAFSPFLSYQILQVFTCSGAKIKLTLMELQTASFVSLVYFVRFNTNMVCLSFQPSPGKLQLALSNQTARLNALLWVSILYNWTHEWNSSSVPLHAFLHKALAWLLNEGAHSLSEMHSWEHTYTFFFPCLTSFQALCHNKDCAPYSLNYSVLFWRKRRRASFFTSSVLLFRKISPNSPSTNSFPITHQNS